MVLLKDKNEFCSGYSNPSYAYFYSTKIVFLTPRTIANYH